jgi:hypothetical protein
MREFGPEANWESLTYNHLNFLFFIIQHSQTNLFLNQMKSCMMEANEDLKGETNAELGIG